MRAIASKSGWAARAGGNLGSLSLYAMMPAMTVVNALVGLMLPALLGPARFGEYATVVTLSQYALIVDFGGAQLIDRRVPVLLSAGRVAEARGFGGELLWLRLYVAAVMLALGTAALAVASARGAFPFGAWAGLLSLASGLLSMIVLGPVAIYRASLRRRAFALVSLACSVILAVSRPVGIVLGGIPGCFAAQMLFYAALAVWLLSDLQLAPGQQPGLRRSWSLLVEGFPLLITSLIWVFYLTANRWVMSYLVPQAELGRFAFGTNIVCLIVGAIGGMAQFYYPKIVRRFAADGAFSVSFSVLRDFAALALLVSVPTALGIIVGPWLIDQAYPKFVGSEAAVRLFLVALPSLVVASWLMPLSLSTAARPWLEGTLVYPVPLVLLVVATRLGFAFGGIAAAASGFAASAVPLLAFQLCSLHINRLIKLRDAVLLFLVVLVLTVLLAALAL